MNNKHPRIHFDFDGTQAVAFCEIDCDPEFLSERRKDVTCAVCILMLDEMDNNF